MVNVTLGIDLGSFYSRIAAVIDDTVSVIEIYDERKLSSLVSLKSGTLLNGIKARNTASSNMILDACRLQHEKPYSQTWCFAKTCHGKCAIETKSSLKTIIPQQDAIAALLRTLIEAAEKRLGNVVDKVVITIPDYIDHYFRCLILDATKLAKINDVQLITQNTAAAITYIRSKPHTATSTCFMIFNFGANQLSISVFENCGKSTKLIYANSEETIGGEDFTIQLTENFLGILKYKEGNREFAPGTKTLKNLREVAEKAKIDLSLMEQTECTLEVVEEKRCHSIHFSRADFENFCQPLLQKVENAIKATTQNVKQNISEIIMVGGSSRIFAVKQFLKSSFPYASFNSTLVPEEAIVCGAAIKAEMLNKSLNSGGVGDIPNTANYAMYCETDFAKIQLIKAMEAFPNTPRCFSYLKELPRIEFFEKSRNLQSLGYIENVPANSYFYCKFDNNGLLQCFIDEKIAVLKHDKEAVEIDNSATAKNDSNETKQHSVVIDMPKNNEREMPNNHPAQTHPSMIPSNHGHSALETSNITRTHNIPIKSEALINSYGSCDAPPPPLHHTNSGAARSNTVDHTTTASTNVNKTSPYNSLSNNATGIPAVFNIDKSQSLINQHSLITEAPPPLHSFVDTHAQMGSSSNNASYNRYAQSDRDASWVKVNSSSSHGSSAAPQYNLRSSSSNSYTNKTNDQSTTSSTASRNPSSFNNPAPPSKEKEKTYGKFPSETRL